jgi:hypothetical protein
MEFGGSPFFERDVNLEQINKKSYRFGRIIEPEMDLIVVVNTESVEMFGFYVLLRLMMKK